MIANAKVSAQEKWNYGEYEQPKTTLEKTKNKEKSNLHWNRWPTNNRSTFHGKCLQLWLHQKQLSANSAASADDDLQADINITPLDFFKTRIDDSTQFNIPLTTTKQVEENMKPIGGNKATGLNGFGIKIIKLALPAISFKAQLTLYNTVNDLWNKSCMNCGNEMRNEEMIVAVNVIYAIA